MPCSRHNTNATAGSDHLVLIALSLLIFTESILGEQYPKTIAGCYSQSVAWEGALPGSCPFCFHNQSTPVCSKAFWKATLLSCMCLCVKKTAPKQYFKFRTLSQQYGFHTSLLTHLIPCPLPFVSAVASQVCVQERWPEARCSGKSAPMAWGATVTETCLSLDEIACNLV